MKRKVKLGAIVGLATLPLLLVGCTDKGDLYDPDFGKAELKPESEYFDFSTRGDVQLTMAYGAEGAYCPFEIYAENPMADTDYMPVKRNDLKPIHAGFMDANGNVNETMYLPATLAKVWVYTSAPTLPRCEEVEIHHAVASYKSPKLEGVSAKSTRADGDDFGSGPVVDGFKENLQNMGTYGKIDEKFWGKNVWTLTDFEHGNEKYGKPTTEGFATPTSFTGLKALKSKINAALPEQKEVKGGYRIENPNIKVKENANINLTFVGETTGVMNSFGYYYYKVGTEPDLEKIPKYMIFPNVSVPGNKPFDRSAFISLSHSHSHSHYLPESAPLNGGETVKLQFFGEDYTAKASYDFPAGYVIGWFIIPKSYPGCKWDAENEPWWSEIHSSNEKADDRLCKYFVSVYDSESGKTVIGVDDAGYGSIGGDNDFNDMLFYVDANPAASIVDPDTPIITTEDVSVEYTSSGTYAFEDIWPDGGDYDMNDVIVEYDATVTKFTHVVTQDGKEQEREVYYTKLKLDYRFVHDGATYRNAFGIQLDDIQKSDIKAGAVDWEAGNTLPSVIVCPNAREAVGTDTKTIEIEFEDNKVKSFSFAQLNPFIVVNNDGSASGRTEVHLPKRSPTSLAAQLGEEGMINQYYVEGKEGNYPFAIDIPKKDFVPVTETVAIDAEYPDFAGWVQSSGTSYVDWYMRHQSAQN